MNYQEIIERLPLYQVGDNVTIMLESGEDKTRFDYFVEGKVIDADQPVTNTQNDSL